MPTLNTKIINSLTEAKALFGFAVPIIIAHFAVIGMSITDIIIAGQASAEDLAGLAVSVNLWVPASMLLIGLLFPIVTMTAQQRGAQNNKEITKVLTQGCYLAIALGVAVGVIMLISLPWVETLKAEAKVTLIAQDYLFYMAFGVPALTLDIALHSWLEGLGRVRPIMLINLLLLLLNIPLNYALVLGHWGLPALGGAGCGLGTAILYWISLICTLIYLFKTQSLRKYFQHGLYFSPKLPLIKQIAKFGLPIGLALVAEEGFISAIVLISTPLGTEAIGGLQIVASYMMLIIVIAIGMGQSINVRIAHSLGKGQEKQARYTCYQGLLWTFIIVGFACIIALIASNPVISLFSDNNDINAIATNLMWLTPFAILPSAIIQAINGTLRSYKDTFIPMVLLIVGFWIVAVPLAYIFINVPFTSISLGAAGGYISYIVGFSLVACLLFFRLSFTLKKAKYN